MGNPFYLDKVQRIPKPKWFVSGYFLAVMSSLRAKIKLNTYTDTSCYRNQSDFSNDSNGDSVECVGADELSVVGRAISTALRL